MKFKTDDGQIYNRSFIKTQKEINHIKNRGFFGKNPPKIGDVSMYLGPDDGGFAVFNRNEIKIIEPDKN